MLKPSKHLISFILALGLTVPALVALQPEDPGEAQKQRVRDFVQAYNDRDLEALLSLSDEEIEWLSVSGNRISTDASGKLALYESLEAHFEASSTTRSELMWLQVAGSRVAAMERAIWKAGDSERSQFSLSVYEFEGNFIRRVYYYPAEQPKPERK